MNALENADERRLKCISWQMLVPVGVTTLKVAGATGLDVFLPGPGDKPPQLYRDRNLPISRSDYDCLEINGIRKVFILRSQHKVLLRHVRECAPAIAEDDQFAATDRFQTLQSAFAAEVNKAFCRIDVGEAVRACSELGNHLAKVLSKGDFVPRQLFDVMQHDASTFTHVVNVASYCVILANRLGINEQGKLEEIAAGGMLHDVGKRHIPPAILTKPDRLSPEEFQLVKEHPITGYCDVCERSDVTYSQLMMIYQHHERMDGSGYPVGIVGDEIHPWGRLCAIVDVFEAITGERPYRKAAALSEAIEIINQGIDRQFDKEMAQCWIALMSKQ